MTKTFRKKLIAAVLCFAVLLGVGGAPLPAYADDRSAITDLNQQIAEKKKEEEQLKNQIASAQNQKEEVEANKQILEAQIVNTKEQINLLGQRIEAYEEEIARKEEEIAELNAQMDADYELFKQRLRAMYMSSDPTMLTLLLGSENYADFLMKTELMRSIAEHDQEILDNLKRDLAALEAAKQELDEDKAALEADKEEADLQRQQLTVQTAAAAEQIQNLGQLEAEIRADLEASQQERARMESELADIYARLESSGEYVGGVYTWPLPGYSLITSEYGWRFSNTDFHTGFDISGSGVYGATIVAANSGTVAFKQTSYTAKSYGMYLIIDHGGGYSTLYAHCSAILVNVGDTVTRGQAIALVGSTGWSTGPHLHFEYRINGEHVNPRTLFPA